MNCAPDRVAGGGVVVRGCAWLCVVVRGCSWLFAPGVRHRRWQCQVCFCKTTFDHKIGEATINTPAGCRTMHQICQDVLDAYGKPPADNGDREYVHAGTPAQRAAQRPLRAAFCA